MDQWNLLAVNFEKSTGKSTMFMNDQRWTEYLVPPNNEHHTAGPIRMGSHSVAVEYDRHFE